MQKAKIKALDFNAYLSVGSNSMTRRKVLYAFNLTLVLSVGCGLVRPLRVELCTPNRCAVAQLFFLLKCLNVFACGASWPLAPHAKKCDEKTCPWLGLWFRLGGVAEREQAHLRCSFVKHIVALYS